MVKNRLIFTLLLHKSTYMLSRNFELQAVGDLNWIRDAYNFDAIAFSIDELLVLNVERNNHDLQLFSQNLIELNKNCFMPISAGGGIRSIDDAYLLLDSGADKLIVNTSLLANPQLVKSLVKTFGSQSIIASLDYKRYAHRTEIFTECMGKPTGLTVQRAVKNAISLGCGEIYLTSIDNDGTGEGLDLQTIKAVATSSSVSVIAAGGVGKYSHFVEGVKAGADAVATANLFNFMADGLIDTRDTMSQAGIEMATWDFGLGKENFFVSK